MTVYELDPTNPEPRNGDRVKVGDLELTAWENWPSDVDVRYRGCGYNSVGQIVYVPRGVPVHVMREVAPIEDWQPGDVVRDADGEIFLLATTGWYCGNFRFTTDELTRPLTRLIPAPKRDVSGLAEMLDSRRKGSAYDLAEAAYEFLGIKP